MNKLIMGAMLLTWCAGTLAGCATTGKKTSLQVKPLTATAASRGIVYLALSSDKFTSPDDTGMSLYDQKSHYLKTVPAKAVEAQPRITLVNVNDDEGQTVGRLVMPTYSGDLIISGLRKGLTAAGYTVIPVRKLPGIAENGIDITWISAELDQNSGLLTLAGKCDLSVRLDLWRHGIKSASHDYEIVASDYAFTDQSLLLAGLLKKATRDITAQAVATLITDFSTSAK